MAWGPVPPALASQDPPPDSASQHAVMADVVQRRVHATRGVPETVGVDVRDGIVRLTGEVADLFAARRAVAVAARVRGIRGVVDALRVASDGRPDPVVRRDVEAALRANAATTARAITVTVSDGAAVLEGMVGSWATRELSGEVAARVRGVRAVDNRLGVDPDEIRSDADVLADVRYRLRWDARLDGDALRVRLVGDTLRLAGRVRSAWGRMVARDAAHVRGVGHVDVDSVRIDPGGPRPDPEVLGAPPADTAIARAVRDALAYDPRLAGAPQVTVDDAIVTLSGRVQDVAARRAATHTTAHVRGVVDVRNELRVRPSGARSDDAIADALEDALARTLYVDTASMLARVVDGTVYLYGTVPTAFARWQAEETASSVLGVESVENSIRVDSDAMERGPPYWEPLFAWEQYVGTPLATGVAKDPRSSDAEIAREIRENLLWTPAVDARGIQVEVDAGVARLTGRVSSAQARRAAVEAAFDTDAVWVIHRITIGF